VDYFDRIADEWRSRAKELAAWTMAHLTNRTDVWGRYLGPRAGQSKPGVVTAPFQEVPLARHPARRRFEPSTEESYFLVDYCLWNVRISTRISTGVSRGLCVAGPRARWACATECVNRVRPTRRSHHDGKHSQGLLRYEPMAT